MAQLHRKFTDTQVKELIQRYLRKEIQRDYIQQILGIKKKGTEQAPRNFLFNIIESPKPESFLRVSKKILMTFQKLR